MQRAQRPSPRRPRQTAVVGCSPGARTNPGSSVACPFARHGRMSLETRAWTSLRTSRSGRTRMPSRRGMLTPEGSAGCWAAAEALTFQLRASRGATAARLRSVLQGRSWHVVICRSGYDGRLYTGVTTPLLSSGLETTRLELSDSNEYCGLRGRGIGDECCVWSRTQRATYALRRGTLRRRSLGYWRRSTHPDDQSGDDHAKGGLRCFPSSRQQATLGCGIGAHFCCRGGGCSSICQGTIEGLQCLSLMTARHKLTMTERGRGDVLGRAVRGWTAQDDANSQDGDDGGGADDEYNHSSGNEGDNEPTSTKGPMAAILFVPTFRSSRASTTKHGHQ